MNRPEDTGHPLDTIDVDIACETKVNFKGNNGIGILNEPPRRHWPSARHHRRRHRMACRVEGKTAETSEARQLVGPESADGLPRFWCDAGAGHSAVDALRASSCRVKSGPSGHQLVEKATFCVLCASPPIAAALRQLPDSSRGCGPSATPSLGRPMEKEGVGSREERKPIRAAAAAIVVAY